MASAITTRLEVPKDGQLVADHCQSLLELSRDAILVLDAEGGVCYANPAACKIFGYGPDTALDLNWSDLYVDQADHAALLLELRDTGCVMNHPAWLRSRGGTEISCLLSASRAQSADGCTLGYQAIIYDVTEQTRAEEELRYSEAKFRTFTETIPAALFILEGNRLSYVNPATENLTGYPREELLKLDFMQLIHPDHWEMANTLRLLTAKEGSSGRHQIKILTKNGEVRWLDLAVSNVPYKKRHVLLASAFDVSDRKRAEDRLLYDAFHDGLTGLANRALFKDRVQGCITRAKRRPDYAFAVLFLDLDRFKVVNDSLGHVAGDQLLIRIGQILGGCIRPQDTVARFGGDEFAVLLEDVGDVDCATRVAQRIQQQLGAPIQIGAHEIYATMSIGIALSSPDRKRPEDLIRDADTAMYRAKSLGKARYQVFDNSMHTGTVAVLQLETELRRATERNEFEVHYQAIRCLKSGAVSGFEALVRWRHPERGLVSPGEFLPLAEETGLLIPIGWWVLEEACRQISTWRQLPEARELTMNVNLSSTQFAQPDLLSRITDVLRQTELPASALKLELTETVMMQNSDAVDEKLRQLRALGIGICLDDFGTGYSALAYLLRFSIDNLKIDRSFVSGMESSAENLAVVQTIIALAHNLGMDVTAEGLETAEQLATLKELQCENAQGYLFSKPMSAKDAFEQLNTQLV